MIKKIIRYLRKRKDMKLRKWCITLDGIVLRRPLGGFDIEARNKIVQTKSPHAQVFKRGGAFAN